MALRVPLNNFVLFLGNEVVCEEQESGNLLQPVAAGTGRCLFQCFNYKAVIQAFQ